uniref:peptidyl-tRNA hydrolase n=1 Tax=Amphiprion percula TaxID=161767 RepID=A0A3P8SUH4_AMPPE
MAAAGAGSPGRLVQYVVVRSDLVHQLSWPLGAVITQACHAATAAVHLHYGDPDTQRYLEELDSMHKVVLGGQVVLCTPCRQLLHLIPVCRLIPPRDESHHSSVVSEPQDAVCCCSSEWGCSHRCSEYRAEDSAHSPGGSRC